MNKRLLFQPNKTHLTIKRLAMELIENHGDFSNSAIIGLQPRGILLAKCLVNELRNSHQISNINYGELDSTFYRDDFRKNSKILIPSTLSIDFEIEDKKIILIDDVLYTGRSVRSALNALNDLGRPLLTELLVLIDRKYNRELPIQPDYIGDSVDTRANDKVEVKWEDNNNTPEIWIITNINHE